MKPGELQSDSNSNFPLDSQDIDDIQEHVLDDLEESVLGNYHIEQHNV